MKWRVFLPGLAMLGIAWGPLIILDLLGRPLHWDIEGLGMAWGIMISFPLTIAAGFTLLGGVFALIIGSKH